MTTYKAGSFFVVATPGPGGFWIGVAQSLANDASRYKHAGLILDEDGTILEAEPKGARLANISEYAGDGLLVSDGPVQQWRHEKGYDVVGDDLDATAERIFRKSIVGKAHALVGTRYSWADYGSIGLLHITNALPKWLRRTLRPLVNWLRRYVASTGHAQCAQLVDMAYERAGVHLFTDGRQPGDVCPADLAAWAEDYEAGR